MCAVLIKSIGISSVNKKYLRLPYVSAGVPTLTDATTAAAARFNSCNSHLGPGTLKTVNTLVVYCIKKTCLVSIWDSNKLMSDLQCQLNIYQRQRPDIICGFPLLQLNEISLISETFIMVQLNIS